MKPLAEPSDFAPGDDPARSFDWTGFRLTTVRDADSPLFERAYARLWEEFGERGELERREVLADRLTWTPARRVGGYALLYEMIVVEREDRIVALRDHTAIVGAGGSMIVHLSHALVEPEWRGKGLAAWLRALPARTARECAAAARVERSGALTFVAEMESPASGPTALPGLRSYERAGFRKLDPHRVDYWQPDFRAPAEIDASELRPVPLTLVVRRVGRESEERVTGGEIRSLVHALYAMFGVHVRPRDMQPLWKLADRLPDDDESVALIPPTE